MKMGQVSGYTVALLPSSAQQDVVCVHNTLFRHQFNYHHPYGLLHKERRRYGKEMLRKNGPRIKNGEGAYLDQVKQRFSSPPYTRSSGI